MTARANFKDLIRARMEKTGESYTIAKKNIEAQRLRDESDHFTAERLRAGHALNEDEAASLERRLEEHPDNISARLTLIGYYYARRRSGSSHERGRGHTLWFVKNHPDAYVLRTSFARFLSEPDAQTYEQVRTALFDRLSRHPDDVPTLVNAASHISLRERELAATLYAKAHALAPADMELAFTLSSHLLLMNQPKAALDVVERSLAAIKDDAARFVLIGTAARASFSAKELGKSKQYIAELLAMATKFPTHWYYGNAIHQAHWIRGLIALEAGELDEASAALLASGKTPGSPQLNSFGPNMQLAAELTKLGRTSTVLAYFQLCAQFWKMGKDKLDSWAATVESGGQPHFGPNLIY